jgi:hypothetical protein
MKIAVIGGGISGMISWYLLQRQHEVTVFEAGSYLGGHTATVDVNVEGKDYAIDTGFIVFNNWTYPLFNKFLAELKVESQHTQMSFSVKKADTGLEYNGHTFSTLFAQRRNLFRPSFWRMLLDIVKFNKLGKALLEQNHPDLDLLIDEFLAKHNLGKALRNDYLLPMGAAIWSSGLADMPSFPLRFFLQFFKNHGLLNVTERPQWSVIKGGSRQYVRALLNTLNPAQLKLNNPVKAVNRDAEGVTLEFIDGRVERFDQVVFACHSDQALALLQDASDAERQVLGGIAYQNNEVILHTDDRILPQRKAAWAAWNYHLTDAASSHATLSYNMNILQGIEAPVTFVVTLNHSNAIEQSKILKRFQYAHPVFNHCTIAAQQRRGEINGVNHSWFCGAYWYNGFHEDGARSAVDIARAMEVEF